MTVKELINENNVEKIMNFQIYDVKNMNFRNII